MSTPAPLRRQLCSMLFADVVGFSKLKEEQAPSFFVSFLGAVARLIDEMGLKPLISNTWGDGLFIVYGDVTHAAGFASALVKMVAGTDWQALGLPKDLSVRVGLHTGPVFATQDPVIGKTNFFGSHVTRAARIEPITSPGAVFLTEQAACMLVTTPGHAFRVEYVGRLPLAKSYGYEKLYKLIA